MRRSHRPLERAAVVGAAGALAVLLLAGGSPAVASPAGAPAAAVSRAGTSAAGSPDAVPPAAEAAAGAVAAVAAAWPAVTSSAVAGSAAGTGAAVPGWRADGYGPGSTGYNPVETAIVANTVAGLDYRWSVVSPVVRDSCAQQSPPVVAGGKVYLTDQGGIAAYDAVSGARVWTHRIASASDAATPRLAVLGSRLFAAFTGCASQSDPDSQLRAFDASTGAVLWTVRRDAPMYTIVVDMGTVVVSGQDSDEPVVTAYRITDGSQLWSRQALLPRPVSANGRLLLTRSDRPGSDLVDIGTGEVLWSSRTSWSVLAAGPAGETLYAAGSAGELARVDLRTGASMWSVPDAAAQLSSDGARLYVAQGGDLVARDAITGSELWRRSFPSQLGKPIVAGGVVYATVSGSGVRPLDAVTGVTLDDVASFDGAIGHPVVVNGLLYVTNGRVLDAYGR